MNSRARRWIAGLALVGGAAVLRPGTAANKALRRRVRTAGRRVRYVSGQLQGTAYRLSGGHPDPDVADDVLADRIRSSLGTIEKRLDLPRIHVMVEDHVALLHGEVGTAADAGELVAAVGRVSGVAGVESYLHIGLIRGDTRPSEGRSVDQPSAARQRLIDVAMAAGVGHASATSVVRAILATFADRLPAGEREQVATHLPDDVRSMFSPPQRARAAPPPRTVSELVARVSAETEELPPDKAEDVTAAVLAELRSLVPEEAADVAAVLPRELRELWAPRATG